MSQFLDDAKTTVGQLSADAATSYLTQTDLVIMGPFLIQLGRILDEGSSFNRLMLAKRSIHGEDGKPIHDKLAQDLERMGTLGGQLKQVIDTVRTEAKNVLPADFLIAGPATLVAGDNTFTLKSERGALAAEQVAISITGIEGIEYSLSGSFALKADYSPSTFVLNLAFAPAGPVTVSASLDVPALTRSVTI